MSKEYANLPGYDAHGERMATVSGRGSTDADFRGHNDDENLAGWLYDRLPLRSAYNQVYRHEYVRVLASALRERDLVIERLVEMVATLRRKVGA